MPSNPQDVTGVNSSAMERILLLADFSTTLNGVFNDAANMSHAVFKNYRTLPGTDTGRETALAHSGQSISVFVLYTDYSMNRGNDGSLNWSAPGSLGSGTVPAWS